MAIIAPIEMFWPAIAPSMNKTVHDEWIRGR